jgi:hypothetical protein
METDEIIRKIKEKRELLGLADSIVKEELNDYLLENKISLLTVNKKDTKLIISGIREQLRRVTGQFHLGDAHVSVSERTKLYPFLSSILSSLKVKSVLDLGCGLNPIYLAKENMIYFAYDINEKELIDVDKYFKKNKIDGNVFVQDLRKGPQVFPKTDLCLMLKLFDSLETKGHKLAETIIKKLDSQYLLISFPTKTLSGAPMRHPQRGWIERLLTRLEIPFQNFVTSNEIFYLAGKNTNQREPLLLSTQEMQLSKE